jgi:hypothetical protein
MQIEGCIAASYQGGRPEEYPHELAADGPQSANPGWPTASSDSLIMQVVWSRTARMRKTDQLGRLSYGR